MSLTATASVTTLQKIKELLGLHDARTYHISPDRPNVRLTIKRVSDQGAECMQWLVDMLIEKKEDCKNLQASMLNAIHNSDNHCIRNMILDDFGFSRQEMIPLHLCCSFCANNCTCGVCDNDEMTFLLSSHSPESFAPMSVRAVPPDNLKQLKLNLLKLKEELDGEVVITSPTYIKPDIIHGLSLDIITHIVKEADKLCSIDDLLDFGHIINTVTAAKVLMIFADLFDDLDTDIMGDISDDTDI